MFPSFSDLCTDTFRTHCTILWEKLSGETVLSGAVLTVIADVSLIRWNCTVSWLPSKKSETSFYFRKVKIMTKVVVKKKKSLWISGKVKAATIQLSLEENNSLHQAPIPKFTKTCFPAVSYLWKKLLRITVPCHEKYVKGDFSMNINYHIGCYSQRRQWQPIPVLLPGKSHGWRSLVACSPWDR